VLAYYAQLKGMRRCKPAIDDWLARLSLSDWRDKQVQTLSKGMAQKVQFISAVVTRPELVLLDEPFSGLDPVNMEVLRDAMLDLRREGATLIFSTHDMAVAEKMCDRIFMIYRGRKVLDGTLQAIQLSHGADTIKVRFDRSPPALDQLPGVHTFSDLGNTQELRLAAGADHERVLQALVNHGGLVHYEVTRPSLHDIFIRIARPEAQENGHS
jgi:ABC-2 type transport system ATP-binding protein